jgi:hypothetical protein
MAINIGDAFSYLDVPQEGIGSVELPVAKPFMPGYDQEMNIDDSGRITFKNYLQELRDKAGEGIGTLADKGMSLFDDSRRSNLIRAGLGSVLFGLNPLTAILGAVVGAKTPAAFDYFQQQRDKKAAEEAAAAQREFDRLNAIRQQRDADSMSGGAGETTSGTFGSSVNDPSTFSDYS